MPAVQFMSALFFFSFLLTVKGEISQTDKNATAKFKDYVGTFSNAVGTDMWITVGVAAGGTIFICLVLYVIGSLVMCICGSGKKKRQRR